MDGEVVVREYAGLEVLMSPDRESDDKIRLAVLNSGWRPFREMGADYGGRPARYWAWRHPKGGCIAFLDQGEAEAPIPGEWRAHARTAYTRGPKS